MNFQFPPPPTDPRQLADYHLQIAGMWDAHATTASSIGAHSSADLYRAHARRNRIAADRAKDALQTTTS
ncbi:hypothetical protein [Streptomyces olivaceus]|uniref:hypothetical protein n=1 Tax=Streptomyces olivaceus TaxID=47716 RepID=UPI00363C3110